MPVTVRQALKKGNYTLNTPSGLLFLAGVAGGFILQTVFNYPGWFFAITIAAGILLAYVYWCFAVTKWKIWAYENVDHIHEFQQKAIEAKLLPTEGSFSDRMSYKSASDKLRLQQLEQRFNQKDVYEDDILVPAETRVFFSKKTSGALIVFAILLIGGGVYFLSTKQTFAGVLMIGFGIYLLYKGYSEYSSTTPQIILTAEGIETINTPLQKWKDVQNERVHTERHGKSTTWYLVYEYPGGEGKVDMSDLQVDAEKLENLMHVYRTRSEKAHH